MPLFNGIDAAMLVLALLALLWAHALRRQNKLLRRSLRIGPSRPCTKQLRPLVALVERDLATGLLVGSIPGIPGAHTQASDLDGIQFQLLEVLDAMRSERDTPALESEVIGLLVLDEGARK